MKRIFKALLITLILVFVFSNLTVFSQSRDNLNSKITELEDKIKKLETQNSKLQEINAELMEFKKNYDKDEVIQYYKDMQSDYQTTVTMLFTIFSILITIGVVVIPVYSKYQERKEFRKINDYLEETKRELSEGLEKNEILKKELDRKLEINKLVLEAKIIANTGNNGYYDAIEIIKKSINEYEVKELYELLANLYELDKDIDNVIKTLEQAVRIKKYDYRMVYKLADVYLDRNDYVNALKYFKIAIEEDSENYKGYYSIGKTYEIIEDLESAIDNYKVALDLNPTLISGYIRLSKCYINIGQEVNAIKVLKQGNKLIPNTYKIIDKLVDLLTKNNKKNEAERVIESFKGENFKKVSLKNYLQKK